MDRQRLVELIQQVAAGEVLFPNRAQRVQDLIRMNDGLLRTLLKDALDTLVEVFPSSVSACFVGGYITFLHAERILEWLVFLIRSGLAAEEALSRVDSFYSSKEVDVDVYAFITGIAGLEFGSDIVFEQFTIGRSTNGGGGIDGRLLVPSRTSANQLFIKKRVRTPIGFENEPRGIRVDLIWEHILQPLKSPLELLEAKLNTALLVDQCHYRFSWSHTPLPIMFDKTEKYGLPSTPVKSAAAINGQDVVDLWTAFCRLNDATQKQLSLPLRWLSKSLREREPVDAMVAAGVALEALYLDSDVKEQLTYRLRLNGSLWLRDDSEGRKKISKELATCYTARSKSVHGAGVPKPHDAKRARDLVAEGILLALKRGYLPMHWHEWITTRLPPA